jgi:hypothetical protein
MRPARPFGAAEAEQFAVALTVERSRSDAGAAPGEWQGLHPGGYVRQLVRRNSPGDGSPRPNPGQREASRAFASASGCSSGTK